MSKHEKTICTKTREEILEKILPLLDAAGEEELELFLIFLDSYLRKKKQKGAGR